MPVSATDPVSKLDGYRDAAGSWRIPPQFSRSYEFQGGLAFVEFADGRGAALIDLGGRVVLDGVEPAFWIVDNVISQPAASEGLLAARDAASNKVGFVDARGRWVIPPRFADAFEFHEGLAAVRLRDRGPLGFIDPRGKVVIAARFGTQFRRPPVFSEGLAAVGLNDLWPRTNLDPPGRLGYIDRQGRWVIQPRYDNGSAFVNGKATVTQGERTLDIRHPLKR